MLRGYECTYTQLLPVGEGFEHIVGDSKWKQPETSNKLNRFPLQFREPCFRLEQRRIRTEYSWEASVLLWILDTTFWETMTKALIKPKGHFQV